MPGRRKLLHLLPTVATFAVAYAMIFSLVPTWAVAGDDAPDGAGIDTTLVADDPAEGEGEGTGEQEGPTEPDQGAAEGQEGTPEEGQADDAPSDAPDAPDVVATEEPDESSVAEAEADSADPAHITYTTHVQSDGWKTYVSDGEMAGTQGRSLRLEGIRIKVDLGKSGLTGGVQYRVHGQNYGWQGWKSNDAVAGSIGKSQRLEAIQIRLTGELEGAYDIYYSVHCQSYGWMAWAKNGQTAGSAGQSKRLEAIRIVLVRKGDPAPDSGFVAYGKAFEGGSVLSVQAHVQSRGWMKAVGNGGTAGTTGKSLRLEALRISAPGLDVPGSIEVAGHVQGKGWTGYKAGMAGSVGQSKRLEAIRVRLTGEAASAYDIYYRAHVQNLGWLNWATNGAEAGTSGMSRRIEAVQVRLVRKGASAPSSSGSAQSEAYVTGTGIGYTAYCQSIGWRGESWNGAVAGTTGQSKRLEALKVRLSGGTIGGGVSYKAYVAGSGWQGGKANNQEAGTTGQSKGVEGIQIRLTGRAAQVYDVYYQTHVASAGWLGWARNGQSAGAPGTGRSIQAIKVKLVPKGEPAPGSTANYQVNKAYFDDPMIKKAQGYSSPTGWLILVDDAKTRLAVFRGSRGNWKRYDTWRVTTGAPTSPSKHGVFSVGDRGYSFGHGYTCYYWVSWSGPYLFHSIKYNEGTFVVQDPSIGKHVSGGCVRMPIDKAKWIYDTIPYGTTVVVY